MNRNGQTRRGELDTTSVERARTSLRIPLEQKRLQAALDQRCADEGVANGWDVRVVATTASTNSDLLREVRSAQALPHPIVLAAENQTAGRGRLGRVWHSAPGASLTASYALRVERRLGELEGLSLVCGLAVRDALAGHGVRTELKWPNDVLAGGRKLAGILVEAHALAAATVVVVGVGINVLPPHDFDNGDGGAPPPVPAIDLREAGCPLEDRNVLAADLAIAIEKRLARFSGSGFAAFASEWNAVDAFRDRQVSLGTAAGIARGVDATGHLVIEIDGQAHRFMAGDLSLRTVAAA